MKRQNVRKCLLITSLLLFPITIWYFSPYLILAAGFSHIVNGSFIVFISLFLISLFGGRAFCGYLCPMGGLQECAFFINERPIMRSWKYKIRYVIWILWIAAVVSSWIFGKGILKIDPYFMTDHGISVSDIYCYIIYYGILILFFVPAIIGGKRFACHYFCWIAPFMEAGSKLGRALHLPQLHINAKQEECISCGICSKKCPMSIDVKEVVKNGHILDSECINCGACIDSCPKKVLSYRLKWEKGDVNGKREKK